MDRRDSAQEQWEWRALANVSAPGGSLSPRQLAALLEAERLARRARFLIDNGLTTPHVQAVSDIFPVAPRRLVVIYRSAPLLEYRLVALFAE